MIAAYFDESADGSQERVFAVGGFIGRNANWLELEVKWKALLKHHGVSFYHASDCLHGRKEFSKFRTSPSSWADGEEENLRRIHNEFLDLAIESGLTGLVEAIDLRDYYALARTPANKDMFGGTPYYLCYHLAMRRAIEAVKELEQKDPASSAIIAFVCDGHETYSEHMKTVHDDFREANPADSRLVGSLTFDDDRNLVALQAADAFVYEVRKDLFEEMVDPNHKERAELSQLKASRSIYYIGLCKKECLEHFLRAPKMKDLR